MSLVASTGVSPGKCRSRTRRIDFPKSLHVNWPMQVGGELKPDPDLILGRVANPQEGTKPTKPRPTRQPTHEDVGTKAERPDNPRPSWRDAGGGRSNDDAPLNYAGGHTMAKSMSMTAMTPTRLRSRA